ncbi:hypothetical protein GCM10027610_101450 [Dactylosporangium cerinum]
MDRIAIGVDQGGRRLPGMQLVVEEAVDGRPPLRLGLRGTHEFARVGAQQIVAGEPARCLLRDQMRVRQLAQQDLGVRPGWPRPDSPRRPPRTPARDAARAAGTVSRPGR